MYNRTIAIATALLLCAFFASAQTCQVNVNQPPATVTPGAVQAWPRGTQLAYIMYNGFFVGNYTYWPSEKADAIRSAQTKWKNLNSATNADLSFFELQTIPPNNDPPFIPWLQWLWAALPEVSGRCVFDWRWSTAHNTWRLGHGNCEIDNTLSTPQVVDVGMHEVGHSLNLNDCPLCTAFTTVMKAPSLVPANPSACDTAQVRQSAYP
jgi:hypothetical protein